MLNPEDLKETAITYDDVLLVPQYSEVVPSSVSLETRLTKRITLNIPLMSAPMDTVTEAKMAIALAREGGVGVIHKNLKPEEQARQVQLVKRSSNGVIENPVTVKRDVKIREVRALMDANNISGIPVVEEDGTLEGIVTRRDLRFVDKSQEDDPVASVMTWEGLVRRSGETVELPYREKLPNNMMYELREFAGYIASGTQPEKRNRDSILTAAVIEEARRQTGTQFGGI